MKDKKGCHIITLSIDDDAYRIHSELTGSRDTRGLAGELYEKALKDFKGIGLDIDKINERLKLINEQEEKNKIEKDMLQDHLLALEKLENKKKDEETKQKLTKEQEEAQEECKRIEESVSIISKNAADKLNIPECKIRPIAEYYVRNRKEIQLTSLQYVKSQLLKELKNDL